MKIKEVFWDRRELVYGFYPAFANSSMQKNYGGNKLRRTGP